MDIKWLVEAHHNAIKNWLAVKNPKSPEGKDAWETVRVTQAAILNNHDNGDK